MTTIGHDDNDEGVGVEGVELLDDDAAPGTTTSAAAAEGAAAVIAALLEQARTELESLFEAQALASVWNVQRADPGAVAKLRARLKVLFEGTPYTIAGWDDAVRKQGKVLEAQRRENEDAVRRALAQNAPANDPPLQVNGPHERQGYGFAMWPGTIARRVQDPSGRAGGGARLVPLTRFSMRIVADVTEHDLEEVRRFYRVEAMLHARDDGPSGGGFRTVVVEVPADQFDGLRWVPKLLGFGATFFDGGQKLRDQVRAAIELLSEPDCEEHHVYAFTGWRIERGKRIYLHAGGALGGNAEVRLPKTTGRVGLLKLPPPFEGDALAEAVEHCLELFFVGPPELTVPLFCMPWRAPLGECPTCVCISAEPETGKTTLAAWVQNHFGTRFTLRKMLESFRSTSFGILQTLAVTGDCVAVVDNLTWRGSSDKDQQNLQKLEALVLARFDDAGKTKGTTDSRTRKDASPRAMPLVTSETLPKNHTTLSRMVVLPMLQRLALSLEQIAVIDRRCAAGVYAGVMARYLLWVAEHWDEIQRQITVRLEALRGELFALTGRPRGSGEVAQLAVGLEVFLKFAQAEGGMSAEHRAEFWSRAWQGLVQCAAIQAEAQQTQDAVERFLGFLRGGILSGEFYVSGKDGKAPPNPGAWGYRHTVDHDGADKWLPGRTLVGCLDEEHLWILRGQAFEYAKRAAAAIGEPLDVDAEGLAERMHRRNLLAKVERYTKGKRRGRLKSRTVRCTCAGETTAGWLCLTRGTFHGIESREGLEGGSEEHSEEYEPTNEQDDCSPESGAGAGRSDE